MGVAKAAITTSLAAVCFLLLIGSGVYAQAPAAPTITVSPTAAIVGATITVTGSGFSPNTALSLQWASVKASWDVQAIPTPQVTGINTSAVQIVLGSAQTNATGSFSVKLPVPADYGGTHFIQAFLTNGTALAAKATFVVEPSFKISPTSGPDGTPIRVNATGLSYGEYSTSYYLEWDNSLTGYMTALGTGGVTNFTFYASGVPGTHYIAIYQGYPGPAYLNPQQGPPSSETQSVFPPYIPYYTNFTLTPENVTPQSSSTTTTTRFTISGPAAYGSFALLALLTGGALFVAKKNPGERKAISRIVVAGVIIVLVAVAGVAVILATGTSSASLTSTSSSESMAASTSTSTSSIPTVSFTPVAMVVRPQVEVPLNTATTGPRISITPDIANVGDNVTVNGLGFAPNATLPLVWTTRSGSNLLGYKLVDKPLRNVTASRFGSFTFTMKVPSDLGGAHFIAARNLTENSNGTLFIQRSATLSATQGPEGTVIQVIMHGVGWDFDTNIVAVDYDNSYIGYGCGFNSGGNVTITIVASGAPGIHDIDVYPSVWWGGSQFTAQQIVEYRYPLLTPQDHPEQMPSFHFTFLITGPPTTG